MILAFLHGKGADKNAYDEQLKKLRKIYLQIFYLLMPRGFYLIICF